MEPVRFWGPHEVVAAIEEGDVIKVTLSPDSEHPQYTLTIPKFVFEAIVSDEKRDWNHVQNTKIDLLCKEVIALCIKYHVTGGELKAFLQTFGMKFYTIIDRAVNVQFTGDDNRFVPGGDLYYEFTLNRAHEIIEAALNKNEA